ncbi:MAG: tetratricopeptide repeat protein, partial [Polaromonas sp.]|nr:tetratricopeptide repeat protein [Polaromonas sp.]
SYDQALALQPDHAQAYNNRGAALRDLQQYQAALDSYERAIALKPDYADAYNNLGVALGDLGRHPEARASYERACDLQPDYAEAHWNLALGDLQVGHFERGWQAYEWRWKREALAPGLLRSFPQPLWLGTESLEGKTILLHAEQGLGDTLQFSRYARLVAQRGARVILEVQPPLLRLLTGLDGVAQVLAQGSESPPFDCHCPLLSLPLAFKTTLSTMPPPLAIEKNPDSMARWAARLGTGQRPRIGLVWSGNPGHNNDLHRSIALADLLGHLPSGPQYVSLQKDVRATDRATLEARSDILHVGDDLEDFTDTAALCELMDGVVSVDTSVAHLAGTLGRKLWLLLPFNPDWRWMLERTDSPWYPGAVLCRQPAIGDWDSVLSRLGQQISRIEA